MRRTNVQTTSPYPDEFALMRAFTSGEKVAYTHIYKTYYLRVFRFAQKFLPNSEDAEDMTADSFVKLWNNRADMNNLDHVRAFLHTSVRNGCLDFLKHQKVKDVKHAQILHQISEHSQRSFELAELRQELLQLVYAEVQRLPEKMREIFLLSYKEGLKPAEIAGRLNLSVQTVHNQKQNAIKLLKSALGNDTLLLALLLCLEFQLISSPGWSA